MSQISKQLYDSLEIIYKHWFVTTLSDVRTLNSSLLTVVLWKQNVLTKTENAGLENDGLQEVSNEHILLMGDFNYPDVDWLCHSVKASASSGLWEFLKWLKTVFSLNMSLLLPAMTP